MKFIVWTKDRVEQLEKLWVDHSALEIAAILGVSRNAVIGKVQRLGLSSDTKIVRRQPHNRTHTARNKPSRSVDLKQLQRDRARTIASPATAIEPLNVTLTDIASRKCRWICNDDMHAPLYCGHDVVAGTDWCPGHYCIVYKPADARRKVAA